MIKVYYTCGVCRKTQTIDHTPGSAVYLGILTDVAGVYLCRDCCQRAVELLIEDEAKHSQVIRLTRDQVFREE